MAASMNIGFHYEQNSLLNKVRINLDFTKLAKIAFDLNKLKVSEYLIGHEKQTVKKIPFLLEIKEF